MVDEGEVNRGFVISAGASRLATAVNGVTKLAGDRQDKSTRWRKAKYGFFAPDKVLSLIYRKSAVL